MRETFTFIILFTFTFLQATSKNDLLNTLNTKVLETIQHAEEIPGLKAEQFSSLKGEIVKTWEALLKDSVIEVCATDKEVRPYFVSIQGILEHVLSHELNWNVRTLKGYIHTPMPATPLCTYGTVSEELVDPTIEQDPARLFTVKARTTIVRDYLHKGAELYIIYPKEGYQKRTNEQQKIYRQELINYPHHLFDCPLDCECIPTDLIGATYIFQDAKGNCFVFSIKMTQAKDPKTQGEFGLWFGPLEHPAIQKRIHALSKIDLNSWKAELSKIGLSLRKV